MAEHRITTHVPSLEIEDVDLVVKVRANDQLLGELIIRRGAVDWRPGYHQNVFRLKWEQFDRLLQEQGRERAP
jgi:hypothetical protein